MTLPIILLPKAQLALGRAMEFYESVRPGYGDLFIFEVERTLDIISNWPEAYELVTLTLRRAPVRRFDELVVYRPMASHVRVVHILAARRDPVLARALDS